MSTIQDLLNHPDVIHNKYLKWYIQLTSIQSTDELVEVHHIVPRCLGGSDAPTNLVRLSLRGHYIAHELLWKCTKGGAQGKLATAFAFMSHCGKYNDVVTIPSRWYAAARIQAAELRRGMFTARDNEGNVEYVSVNDPRVLSGEMFAVSRGRLAGRTISDEHRQHIAEAKLADKNPQHKWYVTTPLGQFNSLGEAARAHDTSMTTVQKRCLSDTFSNWAFSEIKGDAVVTNISDAEAKRALYDKNKTRYHILNDTGDILHVIDGFLLDFCTTHGVSHSNILGAIRSGKVISLRDRTNPIHGCTIIKITTDKETHAIKQYNMSTIKHKYYVITSEAGDILYLLYGSMNLVAEHIGTTPEGLRVAFKNGTPMYNGYNGKTYSKKVPHLYHATIREATPDEITTLSWEILERIVVR